jgi:hypothetical protein
VEKETVGRSQEQSVVSSFYSTSATPKLLQSFETISARPPGERLPGDRACDNQPHQIAKEHLPGSFEKIVANRKWRCHHRRLTITIAIRTQK